MRFINLKSASTFKAISRKDSPQLWRGLDFSDMNVTEGKSRKFYTWEFLRGKNKMNLWSQSSKNETHLRERLRPVRQRGPGNGGLATLRGSGDGTGAGDGQVKLTCE